LRSPAAEGPVDADGARLQRVLTLCVMMLSLWASITNIVPLSISFILLVPLVPVALLQLTTMPRVLVAMLWMYAFFLVSTVTYAPDSFLDPGFYRRDGNVFVTFLPLLIGGVVRLPIDVGRIVRAFLRWATLCNAVFLVIYALTGGTIFEHEPGIYHFLFEAHNAAGGYLAMVTALALGRYLRGARSFESILQVLINGVGLLLTVSRGSILGMAATLLLVVILRERFIKTTIFLMVVGVAVLLWFAYPVWVAAGQPDGLWSDPSSLFGNSDLDLGTRDVNVLDRALYLWPRAYSLFLHSPLIGTGFGSYNDLPYSFVGIDHLVSYNHPPQHLFNAAHAHNTYLHVLGETGLVGLALLCWFLRELWRTIERVPEPWLAYGLKLAFWVAVFSSMTEHRLFTPSEMLPFTIILGLVLARQRWERAASAAPAPAPPTLPAASLSMPTP
jgi:O-antigen ligase